MRGKINESPRHIRLYRCDINRFPFPVIDFLTVPGDTHYKWKRTAQWSELTEWSVWIWVTDTSSEVNIKSRVFPAACVDRLTYWIKLNCSMKALNFAAFTSAGSLIRKLKSPTITCLPDKESSTPVSSQNWSLKSDENVPLGTYKVVTWRVFVPCWSETVWCAVFPVLICFALYVSRKN